MINFEDSIQYSTAVVNKLDGEHPSFAMSKNTQAISPLR